MFKQVRLAVKILLTAFLASGTATAGNESPWQRRAQQEAEWRERGWLLIPHQANYFFPFTYNTSPHPSSTNRTQYKEAKFQLSFKVLLWEYLLGSNGHLYFGYTQLSMWQVYDRNRSSPFRDTNHEPEAILAFDVARKIGNVTMRQVDLGVVHQSNGVSHPDSRSWNRVYSRFIFDHNDLSFAAKPWIRIPDLSRRDGNKDILKFMGYGEFTLSHFRRNHVLSIMVRNNVRIPGNKGAIRVDYSFPWTRRVIGLVQYFNGYGESLLDYNRPNNRFSIGIALNAWR